MDLNKSLDSDCLRVSSRVAGSSKNFYWRISVLYGAVCLDYIFSVTWFIDLS